MLITSLIEWSNLKAHCNSISKCRTMDLLSETERSPQLLKQFDQLSIDFSKQKINLETIRLLIELAKRTNLKSKIEGLFRGEIINSTENRAALHTALRANEPLFIDGSDVNESIHVELDKMSMLVKRLHSGQWHGFSGKRIADVVNIGVGGSDLGPLFVCEALDEFKNTQVDLKLHFVSGMDGTQISKLVRTLNPETTLFILVSKSFTTIDTLSNAAIAKAWLRAECDDESLVLTQHFIGVSTNESKMNEWGIPRVNQLVIWDWVGGRFSVWSCVGLSIAIKLGMSNFRQMLEGASALDRHFFEKEFEFNLPVLLGLIGIWNVNFRKISTQAILPYDSRLRFFPDYLTQLEMESNGKSVTQSGVSVGYDTCPILWGEVGSNAQHAFYQLLHQGTREVNCDFIASIQRFDKNGSSHEESLYEQHLLTLANCFAQSRALMVGTSRQEVNKINSENSPNRIAQLSESLLSPHCCYPGDQPSTTILLNKLTPYSLGQLVALYEHKVFVMASIWNINPFDQWGVELGKILANNTLKALNASSSSNKFDSSTNNLINLVLEKMNLGKEVD